MNQNAFYELPEGGSGAFWALKAWSLMTAPTATCCSGMSITVSSRDGRRWVPAWPAAERCGHRTWCHIPGTGMARGWGGLSCACDEHKTCVPSQELVCACSLILSTADCMNQPGHCFAPRFSHPWSKSIFTLYEILGLFTGGNIYN